MRVIIVALATLFAGAAPAGAASVAVESDCDKYYGCTHRAEYAADPGEANALEVTQLEPGVLRIHDAGAVTVRPGYWCEAEDARTVLCHGGQGERIGLVARLADRDDRASIPGGYVDGGPGDDALSATEGGRLRGGPGRDVLTGSPAGDHFVDGDGDVPAHDRYVGGEGDDHVDFVRRRSAVRVHLGEGTGGEDRFTSVESVTGGAGDDRLIGTSAANSLVGGAGDDVISAGAGDDRIHPGRGADAVGAGAGADTITLPDGLPAGTGDRIACGSGRDLVDSAGERDLLRPGCERFAFNDSILIDNFPHQVVRRAGDVVLKIRDCCAAGDDARLLAADGENIGRLQRERPWRLRLSDTGWTRLRRGGRLVVRVVVREHVRRDRTTRRGVRLELRLSR